MNTQESIAGHYIQTVMRDYQSSYTVFRMNTGTEVITCRGQILAPNLNARIKAFGSWENNKYGRQFSVSHIEEDYSDEAGLTEYLAAAPGVGLVTARDVAKIKGEEIFKIIETPDAVSVLCKIPSVNEARAKAIIGYIRQNKAHRELYNLILRAGGKYNAVSKIYEDYREISVAKLSGDPYIGLRYGLSFEVCDRIALATSPEGKKPNPYGYNRITGALVQILHAQATSGNSYCPYTDLIAKTRKYLGVTPMDEAVATACINAALICNKNEIKREDNAVYLTSVYHQENNVAFSVRRLCKYANPIEGFSKEEIISYAEERCKASYADQQKEAFHLLLRGGIGVLTGGPGTGKSTVVRGLLAAYKYMRPDGAVKLCAPTGRAAQRLKEVTGHEATTIHKLLEYRPYGDKILCKNETDPIEADLIIVDESSMINLDIADLLFSAVKSGTTVILVGDIHQLPAVGAGDVLHDLIASGTVPVVHLTKTYRQAGGSLIIKNAKNIMDNNPKLSVGDDFEWICVENDEAIPAAVLQQFKKYNRPEDVFASQVICPARRKRATGSQKLSLMLQSAAGVKISGASIRFGESVFHAGDKVMFTRNNYADGYFNGDIGVVSFVGSDYLEADVDGAIIKVMEKNLEDVILAYAITVHKLQGSECGTAIVVMPQQPANMLQRNLLYTAITRAKEKVVLISSGNSIDIAVDTGSNKKPIQRYSKLKERLQRI